MAETISCPPKKKPSTLRRNPGVCRTLSPVNTPDDLPLPDLYLIDSRSLLTEVSRIRGLVLLVPFTETSHAATQTVVDALWRLEKNIQKILKMQAQIQSAFVQKAEALAIASQSPRVGFKIIS